MWDNLKASIASVVKTNNNQEITGANLQSVLNTIVNSIGANATFAGVATPSTSPGTPDGPVFWIAGPGTYSNFGQLTVIGDTLGVFVWSDSAWRYDSIFNLNIDDEPIAGSNNPVKSGGVAGRLTAIGYFVCDTNADTAAKTIAATGYVLTTGGNIRIKMTNANTADAVTLNINSTGAKALFYNGVQASSTNSWEAGEIVEVYYDGNRFIASNSQGGGNLIIKEGENTHLVDFVDEEGNLVFYVDGDYVFHAIGNSNDEADDNEIPSKGLVKALINSSIEGIEVPTGDITMKEGDNNHLLDFCDEKGNLVFYVDNDFTFHALLSSVSLHLPSVINTYVGDTLQIFYYPLLLSPNYKHLGVNMFVPSEALNCKSLTRYAEYTSASAGTKTMKFNVFDDSLGILTSKDVALNVVTPASPSSMKNILLIGDSETEGYVNNSVISPSADGMTKSMRYPYAKELMRVLTSSDAATQTSPAGLGLSNIQLIGHLRGDVRHEGYGGRSASWFLGTSSPFYVNGSIDFNAYLSQDTMYSDTSKKGVDYMYILLGANNGVVTSVIGGKLVLDATAYKNEMISLLDKIKSQIIEGSGTYANPNLKVILLSYCISNPTGGAYHILGQGEYGNGMKAALAYYQYYLVNNELAAMSDYSDFVESVFVSHEVDSENAYAFINKQVNTYLSDTEKEYIENVHPNTIGYKMYGHAVARDILSRI